MKEKRYQYISKDGIQWTPWFPCFEDEVEEPYQMKKGLKLLNEYRTVEL